uniref:non-specific serine/threonine protein kinase n=1 Tax=Syphacia muris TaxID=451379 RepID=A0A0N5AKU3_9BILA
MAEPQSPKNFHIASDGYNYLNPPLSTKREKVYRQSINFYFELQQLRGIKQKRESKYFDQCFETERKIGEGSFGEVFRVKSKIDGKHYAVKRTIEPFRNPSDRDLKLREVQKHELIPRHPNLVEFVSAWEENGRLFIQTELCDYSLLACFTLYAFQLSFVPIHAVHHLHQLDILHLDIKPENIFVSNNICKLGDFGLVFDLKCDSYAVAEDGDSKYLAREMLNNPPGKPADIFSLGISILELASDLDLPSRGDGWHILREGQTPEQFMKDISPKLRNLIFLMMEEDPKKRPTAVELFNDPTIQQYLRKRYPANYGVVCIYSSCIYMLTCSPTVSEDMDDVGRRPARREVTPEPSPNSRNFTNNDLFTPDSPRHFHDENCSLLVDSDSPISRFVVCFLVIF